MAFAIQGTKTPLLSAQVLFPRAASLGVANIDFWWELQVCGITDILKIGNAPMMVLFRSRSWDVGLDR